MHRYSNRGGSLQIVLWTAKGVFGLLLESQASETLHHRCMKYAKDVVLKSDVWYIVEELQKLCSIFFEKKWFELSSTS